MKRLVSLLLTAVMLFAILPVSAITVSAEDYTDSQGVTYTLRDDGAYYIVSDFDASVAEVVIPSAINGVPVKTIGYRAFSNCTSLTSITIPDSVTSIGEWAFYDCTSLTSITIPDSVTSIDWCAFYDCTNLTSITLGDSVTTIGEWAFYNCSGLTSITIPDSVTSIGGSAFYGCSSLTSIVIPDSVTYIDTYTFDGCTNLTSIDIPDTVRLGSSVFDNTGLTQRRYGNGYYYGSDSNPYQIFYDTVDTSITSISFHKDTKIIAGEAFCDCTSLTSIIISDSVTSIGDSAFYGCYSLTSIVIPDSVTSIGDCAFAGCTSLTSITIPDSVTYIGAYTFDGCTNLTSITIPDSVAYMGYGAFAWNRNLTDIYCEAVSQPEGWNEYWLEECYATVHWGYIEQTEKEALDSAISDAETLIEDAFSTEQWANIQTALDFAKAYDATDKSDEDIKSVTEALAEIVAGAPLVKGDADRSGEMDQFDYLVVKRGYFDTYALYSGDMLRADIDADGEINQFDYLCIKRAYFGTYTIA